MADLRSGTAVEKYSYKKSIRQRRKMLQPQKSGTREGEDDITDAGLAELTGTSGDPDAAPDPTKSATPYGGKERRKSARRKKLTKKEQADFND